MVKASHGECRPTREKHYALGAGLTTHPDLKSSISSNALTMSQTISGKFSRSWYLHSRKTSKYVSARRSIVLGAAWRTNDSGRQGTIVNNRDDPYVGRSTVYILAIALRPPRSVCVSQRSQVKVSGLFFLIVAMECNKHGRKKLWPNK